MITRGTNTVDPLFNLYATTSKTVVVWGGRNDIANTVAAATVYANIKTFCNARKAAGWKVIILDAMVGNDITGSLETARISLNASLLADFSTNVSGKVYSGGSYGDYLVDIASETNLLDYTNMTYFSDGKHLTAAGYAIAAADVKTALLALGLS